MKDVGLAEAHGNIGIGMGRRVVLKFVSRTVSDKLFSEEETSVGAAANAEVVKVKSQSSTRWTGRRCL
jgi:hypothetical protein